MLSMTKISRLWWILIVVSLWLGVADSVAASEAIAAVEGGLACTVCHDKPGSKRYTDKGVYYEATGSLDGYDAIIKAFRACTTCHSKKPGAAKLTTRGRRFENLMRDMTDLRDWAMKAHPDLSLESPAKAGDTGNAGDTEGSPAPEPATSHEETGGKGFAMKHSSRS